MADSKNSNSVKEEKTIRTAQYVPGVGGKLVMTTVWLSPHHMSSLDEICSYILRNSSGAFRPSRSEIIRLLVERLPVAKRWLKQVRTAEDLRKELKGLQCA